MKPPNLDFVDIVEDLELRGSSAEAQNFDFVYIFEEFELRRGGRVKFARKIPPLNP